jgi:hypothetical protein
MSANSERKPFVIATTPTLGGVQIWSKHESLFGERSPQNYWFLLQQCRGDEAINALSTTSNLLQNIELRRQVGDLPLQEHLLSRLANESMQRRLKPLGRLTFTRIACTVNQRLLLSMPDGAFQKRFSPTLVAGLSIHAHDWIETSQPETLSSGLLPILAEFAPRWELLNRRNFRNHMARTAYLLRTILPEAHKLNSLLEKHLGEGISSLDYNGLSYQQLFAVVFGVLTQCERSVRLESTSIIDLRQLGEIARLNAGQVEQFLTERSCTRDSFRTMHGAVDSEAELLRRIGDLTWTTDVRGLRERPLYRRDERHVIILDVTFALELALMGVYFSLVKRLRHVISDFGTAWGGVFETYILQQLRHHSIETIQLTGWPTGGVSVPDAVFRMGDDLIVLEAKSGNLRYDDVGPRDPERLRRAIWDKFVRKPNAQRSRAGVFQLRSAASAIANAETPIEPPPGRILPVLVVDDILLQAPCANAYLDQVFREGDALESQSLPNNVANLLVVISDELEEFLPYAEAGEVSFADLVDERLGANGQLAGASAGSVLERLRASREIPFRENRLLKPALNELLSSLEDAYDLQPDER